MLDCVDIMEMAAQLTSHREVDAASITLLGYLGFGHSLQQGGDLRCPEPSCIDQVLGFDACGLFTVMALKKQLPLAPCMSKY